MKNYLLCVIILLVSIISFSGTSSEKYYLSNITDNLTFKVYAGISENSYFEMSGSYDMSLMPEFVLGTSIIYQKDFILNIGFNYLSDNRNSYLMPSVSSIPGIYLNLNYHLFNTNLIGIGIDINALSYIFVNTRISSEIAKYHNLEISLSASSGFLINYNPIMKFMAGISFSYFI